MTFRVSPAWSGNASCQVRAADLDHQADLVREGDEAAGLHQPVAVALPPGERLDGDEAAIVQLHDRLVVHRDLAAVDRALERRGQLVATAHALVHVGLVAGEAPLAGLLRVVHGHVGVPQQLVRRAAAGRAEGDPYARVDLQVAAF